jgi:tetratricopeptide (TPR) repeat protein
MFEIAQQCANFSKISSRLVLGLLLMATAGMATAVPENITEAEMKLLPRYCPDTQVFAEGDARTNPRGKYWISRMGPTFGAMHHYCWGLINMNRSRRAGVSENERKQQWETARGDFLYVIKHATPDFVLLPEIYTRLGEVELLRKNPGAANEAFAKARVLKPDYWPAYSHWAEFLMNIGRRPEALKIVSSGLAYSPDAKVLREQFRLLSGKASDIPKLAEKPQKITEPPADSTPSMPINPVAPESEHGEK